MAIIGIKEEMQDYVKSLSSKYLKSGYTKIYTSFIEYLDEKESYNGFDAQYVFKDRLNKHDIIKAGVHYVENSEKAFSKTAIKKYILAITKFYKEYLFRFNNVLLELALPFSSLKEDIEDEVNKILSVAKVRPPISKVEYASIEKYFSIKHKIYSQQKTEIIIRLLLLYGFKFSKIKKFRVEDFNLEEGLLNADNALPEGEFVKIPKQLLTLIESYLRNPKHRKNELMFTTKSGNPVAVSVLECTFKKIKELHQKESFAFCSTGLAKFAILNHIKSGLSIPYIKRITGMENDIINDCVKRFFEEKI